MQYPEATEKWIKNKKEDSKEKKMKAISLALFSQMNIIWNYHEKILSWIKCDFFPDNIYIHE